MDIYALYKQQVGCFWTSEEITLRDDVESFEKDLNDDERHFLSHVLGFFSQADGIVLQNLLENFMNEVQLAESKMFYSMQAFIESEHSIVYSMLIDSLIKDPFERAKLFDAIKNIQAIKEKASWALKWLDTTNTFATRLVAYACVEGILFSGSFCAIFWMKQRCNMPGLSLSNQFISRDEKLHTEHAIALYKKLLYPLPEGDVHAIIREAVEGEKSFILDALPCSLVGMNSASMGQYIEFVADRLAIDLGYSKIYGRDNPFPWMENLGLEGKTNFFEGRPSDYQRAPGVSLPLGGGTEYQSLQDGASDDDDF
jgi:ribonucleotide reductase beta subunit family protein with ferritin-like domain